MTGLCLVTRGFVCNHSGEIEGVSSGGVIREEYEKAKPTIKVTKFFLDSNFKSNKIKNIVIGINDLSIKLGD